MLGSIRRALLAGILTTMGFGLATGIVFPALAEEAKKEDEKKELIVGKWYPTLETGLAFTQGTYTDNWNGGDKGSIVWTLIANSSLENQLTPKANWRNTLKLAFGQTHQQKADTTGSRYWERPQKSTDLIDLESLMRLTLGAFVDPFAAFAFQSQFQDASDPFGRKLAFNPMQFKESAGIARKIIDTDESALLSRVGFTFRQNARKTYLDMEQPLTRSTKSERTNDGGFEWVTDYKSKILEDRISWTSKLIVYQPVFYSGKSALEDLTGDFLLTNGIDPDVAELSTRVSSDWENIWSSQITKVLSVDLYTRWVYDAYDNSVKPLPTPEGGITNPEAVRGAVRRAGQFKETLSIGLTFRFL
jgi:hypothetical protein